MVQVDTDGLVSALPVAPLPLVFWIIVGLLAYGAVVNWITDWLISKRYFGAVSIGLGFIILALNLHVGFWDALGIGGLIGVGIAAILENPTPN